MLQKVTARQNDSLSQRQLVALPYIVAEPTISEGARAAGIARMTLTRWMRDPVFREELERVRRNIAEFAFTNWKASPSNALSGCNNCWTTRTPTSGTAPSRPASPLLSTSAIRRRCSANSN